MPAPALKTRCGSGCQATPSPGAKSSLWGGHKGVSGGASFMVARLSTPVTVNGRVLLGDEGAALYSIVAEGRAGHYGVPGMRERARHIGGKLDVWTGTGAGTQIELSIPGSIAY